MQCIKSWTLIYSTEIIVEVHCSHDLSSMLSLACLSCADPSAVDIFVLDFGSLTEFARRALLREWLSVGSLRFSLRFSSWHQKHTPLRWPRTTSLSPRRWARMVMPMSSRRFSFSKVRIRAVVTLSLTVAAVSASISSTLRINAVVSTDGKVEYDSERRRNAVRVDTD